MASATSHKAKGKAKRSKASATTRSTGGAGFNYEDHVAAWLLVKVLAGEPIPGLESITSQDDTISVLSNLRALAWVSSRRRAATAFRLFIGTTTTR